MQNKLLSFLVKRDKDREFESESARKNLHLNQIILMKKNGLNVEHFRYHITI